MNRLRWFAGAVLGPIAGTAYYAFLRLVNIDGRWQAVVEDDTSALLLRSARCIPQGSAAITFGRRVFTRRLMPSRALVRHELTHVRQYARLGWLRFLSRYGAEMATVGYRDISLEQEARSVAGL